jgi:hypothetical protein
MKLLKQLFCHHDFMTPIKAYEWSPTFLTTNNPEIDEDERTIVLRCDDCEKRITRTQTKSHGSIMTLKHIPEDF